MATNINRRGFMGLLGGTTASMLLAACGNAGSQTQATGGSTGSAQAPTGSAAAASASSAIDYLVLVNKEHKLPDGWEEALDIVHFTNTEDWDVDVEAKAYDAYLKLKEDLEADGVYVDLDSAYRSVAEQQRIVDDFTEKYGEEYTRQTVAVPGYSEHHTGLALDLFLIIDGKGVYLNEEMVTYPEIWAKIHAKLADHGFILRYLPRRKLFTGYSYEPWHIRFIDDVDVAKQIMAADETFEEYLDEVDPIVKGCEVDYGNSTLYADSDMDSALDRILDEFKTWKGCTLTSLRFAGDDACGAEQVAYVNELREVQLPDEPAFDQAIVFETDFHSPSAEEAEGTAWEPDTDYADYSWTLGRTGADGAWHLMTWGYA